MTKLIQSVQRASQIMKVLVALRHLTLSELSKETGLHKTTVLRILNTLIEENWVYKRMGDGKYSISVEIRAMGKDITSSEIITERAGLILDELQQKTGGWPSDIAIYERGKMRILETTRRKHPLMINYEVIGFNAHILWSAIGRTYFSFSSQSRQIEILQTLKKSNDKYDRIAQDKNLIDRLVRDVKAKGYGVRDANYLARDIDFPFQLSAFAVPVYLEDDVIAAVNLVWISELATEQDIVSASLPALIEASEKLGDMFAQSRDLLHTI